MIEASGAKNPGRKRVLNFTAIDFETANGYRGSPCAVGLVRVRDGVAIDQVQWLMKPPSGCDHFARFNVDLHGITPEMVADAPRWDDLLPRLVDFVGDDIAVAHNAAFDMGVIRDACAADGCACPAMRYLCTLALSRRALALPSYRLPFVLDALGVAARTHHEPLNDAISVVEIVNALATQQRVSDLEKLASAFGVSVGHMRDGIYRGSVNPGDHVYAASQLARPSANPNADPAGHLYGRYVVFTGELLSMNRQVAWEECARVGAIPERSTTKKTNVLVIGNVNPATLRPGAELTGKARKAFELQAGGQEIEVMTEDDFLRCLDPAPLDNASGER